MLHQGGGLSAHPCSLQAQNPLGELKWLSNLLARETAHLVIVVLADKMTYIARAELRRGEFYRRGEQPAAA
jgi:hypothetical protein